MDEEVEKLQWLNSIVPVVAHQLRLPQSEVKFILHAEKSCLAYTDYRNSIPEINLSLDYLEVDIVSHEICHGLVYSPYLFISEGLAGFIGCLNSNNCAHLLFNSKNLSDIIFEFQGELPCLSSFIYQRVNHQGLLSPSRFTDIEGRLAHVIASSVMEFCVQKYENFSISLLKQGNAKLGDVFIHTTGRPLLGVLAEWREYIGLEICPLSDVAN